MKGLTTFEIEENDKGILVSKNFDGKPVKQTYALNMNDAEWIRGLWVDEFWGFSRNVKLNNMCAS